MKTLPKILSRLALGLTIVPAFLFLFNLMSLETVKVIMIIVAVLWIATAPIVQKRNPVVQN
ncbi:hypothetical protein [Candidatus Pelagisphaera phototrophica]|uniref:hypothetical protein n=1 Tax=Candidatus Pelagisphaera phototrophica TaxID=2684113 RepID=UPI001A069FAA|nr:hypothetical protein [Candidatus Pelagisphaera phototrophica]QXD31000.1 hypothetical protein GA004_11675 [Candidatus Pelagisphaera phototrophica]